MNMYYFLDDKMRLKYQMEKRFFIQVIAAFSRSLSEELFIVYSWNIFW